MRIGVLTNWFQGTKSGNEDCRGESTNFKPFNLFTQPWYLLMEDCIATIDESTLLLACVQTHCPMGLHAGYASPQCRVSFSVPTKAFEQVLSKWTANFCTSQRLSDINS